jgi:8-oxo-dGTP diphosphatase
MGIEDFDGAKLALWLGERLAVILRDDRPGLPFPGFWDLPGGGREGGEGPLDCALRECREELGIVVSPAAVSWRRRYPDPDGAVKWFFVAHLSAERAEEIVLGDEGQRWSLMTAEEYIARRDAVPAFQARLRDYLHESGGGEDRRFP